MPLLDETHIKVENAMILWDAITRPEDSESGPKYKLKLGLQANNPAIAELNDLAVKCLKESKWKGNFPPGGNWPIQQIDPGQYMDLLPGGVTINPSSTRPVDVYDDKGRKLDPMQYANYIYGGQIVNAVIHCWDYDNKSKGIATGLDGIQILIAQNAPRQNFGGGGYDVRNAFGAAPAQPQQGYQAPAQPQQGYQAPAPGYQAPAQPQQGYQAPGQPQQGYQAPAQPQQGYQPPPPTPNSGWMPPR